MNDVQRYAFLIKAKEEGRYFAAWQPTKNWNGYLDWKVVRKCNDNNTQYCDEVCTGYIIKCGGSKDCCGHFSKFVKTREEAERYHREENEL